VRRAGAGWRRRHPWPNGIFWRRYWKYVSLRDEDDREVALIREMQSLDSESRAALEQTLAQASFVFEVNRIDSVEDELELRVWKVRTDQGLRTFETKLDQWSLKTGD
jgi:hypothetical protein